MLHNLRVGSRTAVPRPVAGEQAVETGTANLIPDSDGRRGWTLYINGMESSHVDLDDPSRLDFEYLRWMGALLDVVDERSAAEPRMRSVMHLGGGGCTLPRYLADARPEVRQLVVEIDNAVIELARAAFGIRSSSRLKLRAGDARATLSAQPDDAWSVVVRDAFAGSEVPEHLRTRQFTAEVSRVLSSDGIYLANLADSQLLAAARREAATLLTVFDQVAMVAEPAQLRGRRYGNVVVAATNGELPWSAWSRRLAGDPVRARLLDTDEVRRLVAGRAPFEDRLPAPQG